MSETCSINRWLNIATTVLFLLLCGCGDELASKKEWSIVQALEAQHRGATAESIRVEKIGQYAVVGIPVKDARERVWVMLNARNPPYYKQLPPGSYSLSREDLKKILATAVVTSTVENCLESHVEESKIVTPGTENRRP
jgi:hypothetical protein